MTKLESFLLFPSYHSARSEAEMRALCVPTRGKVERLQAISLEAYNLSAFRIGTLRACAE
jgi:hypothetical protein